MAEAVQLHNFDTKTSPFAQRVWITLEEKSIKYDLRLHTKANKSRDFLQLYESIWPDAQAVAKVPTLEDTDGTKLTESLVIVGYLESKYKSSGTQLIPDDAALAAKARLFGEIFQVAFRSHFGRLPAAATKAELADAQQGFLRGIGVLDAFLKRHGSNGPFLLGDQYSIAEVNNAPFVWRAKVGLSAHKHFDLLAEIRKQDYQRFLT